MWARPEQRQPAEGPHHTQHHDQPGPANTAGTQRMPHLLRAGSAGPLLSLPAQCGLRRWVEPDRDKDHHPLDSNLFKGYSVYICSCWGLSDGGCKPLSHLPVSCQTLSFGVVLVQTECAHRMKKCIKCQVTITKKIRQGKSKNRKSLLLCCETKMREVTKIGRKFDKFLPRKENIKKISNGSNRLITAQP